jgi:hypothetical protein
LISSETEYRKAREELDHLNEWLSRVERQHAAEPKGLTTASIRKMIARVQEELAEYEAASAVVPPASGQSGAKDSGIEQRT